MVITANGVEIPITAHIGRVDNIGSTKREIIELWRDSPFTSEEVEALSTDSKWKMLGDGGFENIFANYTAPVRYTLWLAQVDPNVAIIEQKDEAIAAITAEKEEAVAEKVAAIEAKEAVVTEFKAAKSTVQTIFTTRKDDILIELISFMDPWDKDGSYTKGDVRKHNDVPYTAIQPSTPNGDMNYAPDKAPGTMGGIPRQVG